MSTQAIRSRENPNLELIAFHGHFATRHSHNSHYLDITRLKHEYSLAHDTALAIANHYIYEKSIDTIICMDGSEVIGAFLARQLTQKILFSVNNNKSICVVTPEYDSNGQLLFRENLVSMIHGRNMLLLISTVNSGKTARRALDCIQYYGGKTQGIAAVFSAIPELDGIPVLSLFTPADIPGWLPAEWGFQRQSAHARERGACPSDRRGRYSPSRRGSGASCGTC